MKGNYQDLSSGNHIATKLCCPVTHKKLARIGNFLVSDDGKYNYQISDSGIPLFAEHFLSDESKRQKLHYDKVAKQYVENLSYPHTIEYLRYLDDEFKKQVILNNDEVAELCCGHGELLTFFSKSEVNGIGVDISVNMLEFARKKHSDADSFIFIQGDAVNLPIQNESITKLFIFGGVHHVPDRKALFSEIFRVLKPGGKFYFREPVSDFLLWRLLRSIIYYLSPALDEKTERPLLWCETVPVLENIGFELTSWKTYGFLGFCFFMNSDVLIFNRYFRYIPGIRYITKIATIFDRLVLKIPFLSRSGLQVIGVFTKPSRQKL